MARGASEDKKEANDTKPAAPVTYQFAIKPVEKPGWEGFRDFVWNTETSEFLGRTASSWFKIGLFYLVYYTFLAGFFIAMLFIFYQTLDDKQPKWQGANGIIGDNPGMGYRPKPPETHIESTLMVFRHGSTGNWKSWVKRLNEYLTPYSKIDNSENTNLVDCDFVSMKPGVGQICKVSTKNLFVGSCQNSTNYGYEEGSPCVLLKLNKIYGWKPDPYTNASQLPEDAPQSLKDKVSTLTATQPKMMGQMVWLSCQGENPADKENVGELEFFPYPGFPTYYFPYANQPDYLSPGVFAHFKNPKRGVLISIECKAWAHNIKHDAKAKSGAVHFELMID